MLIKEIIIEEAGLTSSFLQHQNQYTKSKNNEPVVLSPKQQARAVAFNRKRKIAMIVALRQAAERKQALSKISTADRVAAFMNLN